MKIEEQSTSEKQTMEKIKNNLLNFLLEKESSTKRKIAARQDVRQSLFEIDGILKEMLEAKGIKAQHFRLVQLSLQVLQEVLGEFKSVCSVRALLLETCVKSLFFLVNALIEYNLSYCDNKEAEIWRQVNKVNKTMEREITRKTDLMAEGRRQDEELREQFAKSKRESYYLGKMVRKMERRYEELLLHLNSVLLEKHLLCNEVASMRLEAMSRAKEANHSTSKDRETEPENARDRWLRMREVINEEYHITEHKMVELERDLHLLVDSGLERVKLNKLESFEKLRDVGTSTSDLLQYSSQSSQTVFVQVVEDRGHSKVAGSTQTNLREVYKLDEVKITKSKEHERYSLQYQLRNSLKARELLDELLFNNFEYTGENKQELMRVLEDQSGFYLVSKDLSNRLVSSLEEIDSMKLKFNGIGENVNQLKEENKKLKENNYMYESQNHELLLNMTAMRKEVASFSEKKNIFDLKIFEDISLLNVSALVRDYVSEVKVRLLEVAVREISDLTDKLDQTRRTQTRNALSQKIGKHFDEVAVAFSEFREEGKSSLIKTTRL